MKVEKKQEGVKEVEKKSARKGIAGGAMKVEKKQEGAKEVEKRAARKGIAGGVMKAQKKQEGATDSEKKAARKGIAGAAMKVEKKLEGATEAEKKAALKGMSASGSSGGGGGGEPATVLKSQKLAEGDKAEVGKGKRFPVSQEYIDMLLKEKATCTGAYKVSRSMEYVEKHYKGPHDFRSLEARGYAAMEKLRAGDAKILEQYELYGCAYTEVEDNDSVIDEEKISRYLSRWPPAA